MENNFSLLLLSFVTSAIHLSSCHQDNYKLLLLVLILRTIGSQGRKLILLNLIQSYGIRHKGRETEPEMVVHFKVEVVTPITKMHNQCYHSIKQLDRPIPDWPLLDRPLLDRPLLDHPLPDHPLPDCSLPGSPIPYSITEVPHPARNHRDINIPRCLVFNRNMVVVEVPHRVQVSPVMFLMASCHTTPNHSYLVLASGYGHLAHNHKDTNIPMGLVCSSKGFLST